MSHSKMLRVFIQSNGPSGKYRSLNGNSSQVKANGGGGSVLLSTSVSESMASLLIVNNPISDTIGICSTPSSNPIMSNNLNINSMNPDLKTADLANTYIQIDVRAIRGSNDKRFGVVNCREGQTGYTRLLFEKQKYGALPYRALISQSYI